MGGFLPPSIALVTSETRLSSFLSKWGTKGAAKFRVGRQRANYQAATSDAVQLDDEAAGFDRYVEEDERYQRAVSSVRNDLEGLGYPVVGVSKNYLPTYYFGMTEAVVVVGPDGLVANTAKYAGDLPIIGINPDPDQIDGVLLPFRVKQARRVIRRTLDERVQCRSVTLGQVTLSDGQSMLAFNDFFVGRKSHVSSRYVLYSEGARESQSSSGVIVSTGAGSTGWLSSVYNMTRALVGHHLRAGELARDDNVLPWDASELRWVVREPFQSRSSGTQLVAGTIDQETPLRMESLMPDGGIVFSDGVEEDFLEFNSGSVAEFSIAPKQSRLVVEC